MSILFLENPLVVNTTLAKRIGLNESIVLQQLNYWMRNGKSGVDHNGRKWIYNTYSEWVEQFPFWSESTVKRTFSSLKKLGLIEIEQLRKTQHIRTNYYTINFGHELLFGGYESRQSSMFKGSEPISSYSPSRSGQDEQLDEVNLTRSMGAEWPTLTETTTETTTKTSFAGGDAGAPHCEQKEIFEEEEVLEAEVLDSNEPRVEIPEDMPGPKDPKAKTYRVWANYAIAYRRRYSVWPVWNARTAGQISQFVDRLGKNEAPKVAAFYLTTNDSRVINDHHSVGFMLSRAESLYTQWITGRRMNNTIARQIERTEANYEAAVTAIEGIQEKQKTDIGELDERKFYIPN